MIRVTNPCRPLATFIPHHNLLHLKRHSLVIRAMQVPARDVAPRCIRRLGEERFPRVGLELGLREDDGGW